MASRNKYRYNTPHTYLSTEILSVVIPQDCLHAAHPTGPPVVVGTRSGADRLGEAFLPWVISGAVLAGPHPRGLPPASCLATQVQPPLTRRPLDRQLHDQPLPGSQPYWFRWLLVGSEPAAPGWSWVWRVPGPQDPYTYITAVDDAVAGPSCIARIRKVDWSPCFPSPAIVREGGARHWIITRK